MSEWKPINEAKTGRYLLWVADQAFTGAVMGRVVNDDNFTAYLPDGFHGDFNVTHFTEITPPKP